MIQNVMVLWRVSAGGTMRRVRVEPLLEAETPVTIQRTLREPFQQTRNINANAHLAPFIL